MSNAYKCDGCGEFQEGNPNRVKLQKYNSVGLCGAWTNSTRIVGGELCESCYEELSDTVAGVLG